jgi:hypothetical protein
VLVAVVVVVQPIEVQRETALVETVVSLTMPVQDLPLHRTVVAVVAARDKEQLPLPFLEAMVVPVL